MLLILNLVAVTVFADSAANNDLDMDFTSNWYPSMTKQTVVIQRVDVPAAIARADITFSLVLDDEAASKKGMAAKTGTTWDVGGTVYYDGVDKYYSKAVGWSGEYSGTTLLSTYHYTRTFFGTVTNNLGDSGRVWGTGKVWAYGSKVPTSQVTYMTQRVYYGTTV